MDQKKFCDKYKCPPTQTIKKCYHKKRNEHAKKDTRACARACVKLNI